jgi:hypothetical protein
MIGEYSKGFEVGIVSGREFERERITALAERRVCFGHQETGNCEHSVCFGMRALVDAIAETPQG